MIKKSAGFTLAEVLITLGIIGIVAAMTIPTLMANSAKQEYVTSLKKFYTTFNQALAEMALDNGCTGDLKCIGLFENDSDASKFGAELIKYIKVSINCQTTVDQGCFATANLRYDGTGTTRNYDSVVNKYRFITADGMSVYLSGKADGCASYDDATAKNNMTQVCGSIIVDINGLKRPNDLGRDIFYFFVTNGKGPLLYPWGGADDNYTAGNYAGKWQNGYCGPDTLNVGNGYSFCAGRIMEEGWQMNY